MPTQPKLTQPAYLLAGVLFTAIALVAVVALFILKSAADVTTQQAYPGASAPTVDSMYVAESSLGADIGPAGVGAGFTTNEGLPKNIFVGGTITDLNGCHNLMQATVTLYRSGLVDAQSCAADTNECYHTTLYPEDFVGCDTPEDTTVTFETSFSLPNYVDPTDAGSPYEAENWVAYVNVADNSELSNVLTETYEVASLAAFSVPNAINYGTVALGGDSNAIQLTFSNTGNRDVDSDVYAVDDMVSNLPGFNNISASAVHYSLSALSLYDTDTAVSKSPSTDLALGLVQQTDDLTIPTTDTYWRLRMPASGVQGTYTNTVVFTAKAAVGQQAANISLTQMSVTDYASVIHSDINYTVYGYVYVFSSDQGTLKIVDYSDTANPVILNTLSGVISPYQVTLDGNYLYVKNDELTNNFQIIDVTNPQYPFISATINTNAYTGGGDYGGTAGVAVSGNYAFITGTDPTYNFKVVNITNKNSPTVSTGLAFNDMAAINVHVYGNYAYVMGDDGNDGYFIRVVDISTPTSPSIVDTFQLTLATESWKYKLSADGNYAYIVGANDFQNMLEIVDISNPASMSNVGFVSINNNFPSDLAVDGNYVYVVDYADGGDLNNLNVVDVSDPANAVVVGQSQLTGNTEYKLSASGNSLFITDLDTYKLYIYRAGDVALSITNLNPSQWSALDPQNFTLVITGTGFESNYGVRWNNTPRETIWISPTEIRASIMSTDVQSPGQAKVTVRSPSGAYSNANTFTIQGLD